MAKSFLFALGRRKAEEQPTLARLTLNFEGWLLRSIWSFANWLGVDRASRWGGNIFGIIGPWLAKNAHVMRNLSIALPDISTNQRAKIARQVWRETGRVIAEFPHLDTICGRDSAQRLEIVDHYGLDPIRNSKKAAVFVTAHFGNWELAAGICRKVPFNLSVLHTNFSNPKIEDLLMAHRKALGCEFIPRQKGARGMIKALQNLRSVGVVMDQRYDEGELVPFFGVPAPTGTAAAAIAIKLKTDFVPVKVERTKGANYRVTFFKAIEQPQGLDAREQAFAMTKKVLEHFEDWIKERPELWMCLKRRWPKEPQLSENRTD